VRSGITRIACLDVDTWRFLFRRVAQVSGAESHVSQKRRDMGHPVCFELAVETL
jgi:hypothetical protein